MKKSLVVGFADLLSGGYTPGTFWLKILEPIYDVKVAPNFEDADILFYSDWGTDHQRFKGRKIYFTGENMLPNYDECDFAITSCLRPGDPRHYRLPYFIYETPDPNRLIKPSTFDAEEILRQKRGFCAFVASNPRAPERNRFFKMLHKRQPIDSAGRHFNTVGYRAANKIEFLAKHKFAIAFENSLTSGYTTEKLTDAMFASTVPIYWGNPDVGIDFNSSSFINAAEFPSFEALIDHILKVHADDELYLKYLRQPWLIGNKVPDVFNFDLLRNALGAFIESNAPPGLRRYQKRRLRAHTYESPFQQTVSSLSCRLESLLWRVRHGA